VFVFRVPTTPLDAWTTSLLDNEIFINNLSLGRILSI